MLLKVITTTATPWLNKKHVVFGEVIEGVDVVKKIEKQGTQSGNPLRKVFIRDCGEIRKETESESESEPNAKN